MVRIGEFRSSETGGKWGRPGDQVMPVNPGKTFDGEVRIRAYDGGFTTIYRPISVKAADSIAYNMEAAALNRNVGYSQNNGEYPRTSFYDALKAAGGDASKIDTPCNSDCSAGAAALINNAGIPISLDMWTGNMPELMEKTRQFMTLDIEAADSDSYTGAYLMRGDILYRPGHVAIVLESGEFATGVQAKATGDVWQRLSPGVRKGTEFRAIAKDDYCCYYLPPAPVSGRDWYITQYNGFRGWASSRYVQHCYKVQPTASVHVRILPRLGSTIIDTVYKYDYLIATGAEFTDDRGVVWYQVIVDNIMLGWISSMYSVLNYA